MTSLERAPDTRWLGLGRQHQVVHLPGNAGGVIGVEHHIGGGGHEAC